MYKMKETFVLLTLSPSAINQIHTLKAPWSKFRSEATQSMYDGDVVVRRQIDERNEERFHIWRCISDSKILPQSMLHVWNF